MATINVAEAEAKLSQLLDRASAGEVIVISRAGKPVARLVALDVVERRKPGAWRGWEASAEGSARADGSRGSQGRGEEVQQRVWHFHRRATADHDAAARRTPCCGGCLGACLSSWAADRSNIESHVKPLLGRKLAASLTHNDVVKFQRDVAVGKTSGCAGLAGGRTSDLRQPLSSNSRIAAAAVGGGPDRGGNVAD